MPTDPERKRYRLVIGEAAEADMDAAYRYLLPLSFNAAESWLDGLMALLERECELQAEHLVQRPLSRELEAEYPLFQLRYLTRSRSLWRVLFELQDADEDGQIDSLIVHRVRSTAIPVKDSTTTENDQ